MNIKACIPEQEGLDNFVSKFPASGILENCFPSEDFHQGLTKYLEAHGGENANESLSSLYHRPAPSFTPTQQQDGEMIEKKDEGAEFELLENITNTYAYEHGVELTTAAEAAPGVQVVTTGASPRSHLTLSDPFPDAGPNPNCPSADFECPLLLPLIASGRVKVPQKPKGKGAAVTLVDFKKLEDWEGFEIADSGADDTHPPAKLSEHEQQANKVTLAIKPRKDNVSKGSNTTAGDRDRNSDISSNGAGATAAAAAQTLSTSGASNQNVAGNPFTSLNSTGGEQQQQMNLEQRLNALFPASQQHAYDAILLLDNVVEDEDAHAWISGYFKQYGLEVGGVLGGGREDVGVGHKNNDLHALVAAGLESIKSGVHSCKGSEPDRDCVARIVLEIFLKPFVNAGRLLRLRLTKNDFEQLLTKEVKGALMLMNRTTFEQYFLRTKEREADDDDEEITRPSAGLYGNYPLPMTAPRLPHPSGQNPPGSAHHPSSYNYSADYKDKSFTTEGGTTPLCGALFHQPAKLVQLRSTWTGPHYRDMPREDKNAERTWQDILGYSFAGLVVRYSGRDAVFIEIKEGVKGPNGNKVNVPPHLQGATLFGHIADFLRRDEFPKSEEGADICAFLQFVVERDHVKAGKIKAGRIRFLDETPNQVEKVSEAAMPLSKRYIGEIQRVMRNGYGELCDLISQNF
eukprot:g4069.t1